MGIAQIAYLVLVSASLLIVANRHGKPKKGNEDFWTSLVATTIVLTILYLGGFFD